MGRRVLERLVAPIVGGVHSADPAELELAAASPRLATGLFEHGSLVRTVRRLRGGGRRGGAGRTTGASAGTRVHALAPTMAALPAALSEEPLAAGGIVRTGVEVTGLDREGEPWRVRTARGERLEADRLVLACPPDTARALLAVAAPEIAEAIPETPSAAVRLVALVLDAPALDSHPSGTGALVAPGTPGIRAKALTHASAKWEHVERAAREALPSAASPHLVRLSYGRPGEQPPGREEIVDLALADASAILGTPLTRSRLADWAVIDWDRAMRRPRPGHRAALDALASLLEARDDLELVGSWRAGTGLDAIVRADDALAARCAGPADHPDLSHRSHGRNPTMNDAAASTPEEIAQTTRYTSYTVFRRLSGLTEDGEFTAAQVAEALAQTIPLIESASDGGVEILGFYDVSGFRAEDDLMLWLAAEDPEAAQRGLREFERSLVGTWSHREWASVGVHRMAEFAKGHVPSFMVPSFERKQWITVYPFVRSYEWYLRARRGAQPHGARARPAGPRLPAGQRQHRRGLRARRL
ncbi:chlorite dismutase family protein [Brachybacterium sp. GPGPB12]|uniref:chlorite dismutase family protein n=1 Tax=Brachybacterium sp. GPGPB12 TaxID=3023517 RepID=UPI0031344048